MRLQLALNVDDLEAATAYYAKLFGVEPYAWLKATLEKIAAGHPCSRVDELLPWNFNPPSS